jgi:hypothetical protein
MAGEVKPRAINAMQTLRTNAKESWRCIAWSADRGLNIRIQAEDSDRSSDHTSVICGQNFNTKRL